ncbi:hypothetical protein CBS101457_001172 [Exobasidium rhododendri]|nr:hypothetical protein CBS101457_001172 [Exobasidium rhododendri]
MDISSLPAPGTRFSIGAYRGTVRYVGEVPPTSGTWLGVEWDDASRGKHNGVHGDVAYFTCRVRNAGSFIRPSANLSFGSSFLQAVKVKYVADVGEPLKGSPGRADSKTYTRKNLSDIEVEAPNMAGVVQRLSQLHKLREVGLGGWKRKGELDEQISASESYAEVAVAIDRRMGEGKGTIQETCPNIKGLDLSRSLLPSWLELSKITCELPLLESLLLHFNRFEAVSAATMPLPHAFLRLSDLRMDGTRVEWHEIMALSSCFPCLENLQMGTNHLTRLGGARLSARFGQLRFLNLEGNLLDDWQDVWTSMIAFPKLERLILSSNKIDKIERVEGKKDHPKLQHISLWDNPITSWSDLDNLDECNGGLQSLVLGGNACSLTSSMSLQDARATVIARLADLTTFNSAPIRPLERRDAELYYLSQVTKARSLTEAERNKEHPRWSSLSQKHDVTISDSDATDGMSGTLRSKLLSVKVSLSSDAPRSSPPYLPPTAQEVQLNLLTTIPLRLLKSKLARAFSLKKGGKSIHSIWALLSPAIDPTQAVAEATREELRPNETPSDERIAYEMDNLERDLQGYNFSTADEIVLVVTE